MGTVPAADIHAEGGALRLDAVAAGDVVFLYGQSPRLLDRLRGWINVHGQRILAAWRAVEPVRLREKLPHYSHVMLGVGSGLVIHADGKRVSIDVISQIIRPSMSDAARFQVYRYSGLGSAVAEAIVTSAYRYYDQSYGFIPFFSDPRKALRRRKEDTTQFCSRLVAHAYRSGGITLTELADSKVLPLDLYRICQQASWRDVSAEFIDERLDGRVRQVLVDADMERKLGIALSEIFARGDEQVLKGARIQRDFLRLQHKVVRDAVRTEGLLAEYVRTQFEIAAQVRKEPRELEDQVAKWIVEVLRQLPEFLPVAGLSSIEQIVPAAADSPSFVGLPTPTVVRQMQLARETVKIFAYLILGELGMLVIASRLSQLENVAPFRVVKQEYAERFLAAVPAVGNLPARQAAVEGGFLWVTSESDRATCRSLCATIIKVLQAVEVYRSAQSPPTQASAGPAPAVS